MGEKPGKVVKGSAGFVDRRRWFQANSWSLGPKAETGLAYSRCSHGVAGRE